jgi:hypothetical protein
VGAVWIALLVGVQPTAEARGLPRCDDRSRFGPDRSPYPCNDGWSWNLTVGPFAGYRFGAGAGGHFGGEVSFLFGPRTDDGAHSSHRSFILGVILDLGYLSSPGAFRAALEAQISGRFAGVSLGPSIRTGSGETAMGGSITAWIGFGIYLYGRYGLEHPSRSFGEFGGMIKIPLRWRG